MSILSSFQSAFSVFLNKAKVNLVKLVPFFQATASVALHDLAEVAAQAVLAEAPKVISGSEKFDSAVSVVLDSVKRSGKQVAQRTAEAAVQLAYLELQKLVTNGSK